MEGIKRRWSALQKREVALRLLRGTPLDMLTQEFGVPGPKIELWRDRFLEAGRAGLRARSSPWEVRELNEACAMINELRTRIGLLERAQQSAPEATQASRARAIHNG